jgi:hypothetical protein
MPGAYNAIEAHRKAQTAPDMGKYLKGLPRLSMQRYEAMAGLFLPAC